MAIDLNLIDKLLADYKKPEDIIGENGLLKQLTKALLERAMQAEMTDHLGYAKHDQAGNNSGNSRNGKTTKALKGDFGELPLETPRDRNGTFEPKIVAKGQTRFTGFDDKIVSMYARGMSTREITGHLEEIYGVEVSPALISNVTEAVMEEVKTWQGRPLDAVYPIVYLDALVREDSRRGARSKSGDLRGDRRQSEGEQRSAGAVDGRGGGRQVLAAGAYGYEEPWGGGHFHRLRGWTDWISQGDRDGVSASAGAVVHRAPGAGVAELCVVETAQGGGRGPANDLSGGHGGGRLFQAGGVR